MFQMIYLRYFICQALNEQKKLWMLYDSNFCKEYKTLKAFLSTLFES
jgi:hypothetical protein